MASARRRSQPSQVNNIVPGPISIANAPSVLGRRTPLCRDVCSQLMGRGASVGDYSFQPATHPDAPPGRRQQPRPAAGMEQADPPWHVESQSAWIAPSSKLEILVPVGESARFLYLEFQVLQGTCIDFDVMLEHPDDKSAIRLYGPSRRANSVRTVLPLPQPGVAYATFDNISSWVTSVQLRYSLRLSCEPPAEQNTFARLRTGVVVGRDGSAGGGRSDRPARSRGVGNLRRIRCNVQSRRASARSAEHKLPGGGVRAGKRDTQE